MELFIWDRAGPEAQWIQSHIGTWVALNQKYIYICNSPSFIMLGENIKPKIQ